MAKKEVDWVTVIMFVLLIVLIIWFITKVL